MRSTSTSTPGRAPRSSSTIRSVPPAMGRAAGPCASRSCQRLLQRGRRLVAPDPLARPAAGRAPQPDPGARWSTSRCRSRPRPRRTGAGSRPPRPAARRARPRCPRARSRSGQSGRLSPSSKPTARASSSRAPHTTRLTPAQGSAPMHMAHGSHDVTSSIGPARPRSWVPRRVPARAMATISAWATGARVASTRLTPAATSWPSSTVNRAAANGPPLALADRGLGQPQHHAPCGRPRRGCGPTCSSSARRPRRQDEGELGRQLLVHARVSPSLPSRSLLTTRTAGLTKRTGRATLGAMARPPATALHADHARLAATAGRAGRARAPRATAAAAGWP